MSLEKSGGRNVEVAPGESGWGAGLFMPGVCCCCCCTPGLRPVHQESHHDPAESAANLNQRQEEGRESGRGGEG